MQKGIVKEFGTTEEIFKTPKTDYTKTLLGAEPKGAKAPVDETQDVVLQADKMNVIYGQAPSFLQKDTRFHAVKNTSVKLRTGQTIGLVGESGSGKSTLGRALLRLTESEGKIVYLGRNIDKLPVQELKPLRNELQMVFQDPYGSLSPRMSVLSIVEEGLLTHRRDLSKSEREDLALETLDKVGLDQSVRNRFPHEFSGGQRQRIGLARALALNPEFIVCDEITSALDVSVQAEVLQLLLDIRKQRDLTLLFITHNIAVVEYLCDETIVMKSGKVVEKGSTANVCGNPQNEYTKKLIEAVPRLIIG